MSCRRDGRHLADAMPTVTTWSPRRPSACVEREYDGEDLRAEPWYLLIPFGASLVTSLLLFNEVWHRGRKHRIEPMPFWRSYRGFLALYWATAPLAWLYAIPVERFLSLMGAIR